MHDPQSELLAEFQAICRGAKLDSKGEVCLDIVVPKDEKYNALPITDNGHIMMRFTVYRVTVESLYDDLADWTPPEGGRMGDGRGERTYRGGKRESSDITKGKETEPTTNHHRKAY